MRIDLIITDNLEDKLLKYMSMNNIKSRTEAVRLIIDSFFAGERLFNNKVFTLLSEIHDAVVKK